jgi:hypothetical protein
MRSKTLEHMSTGRPEAGNYYAGLYNEAQFEIVELQAANSDLLTALIAITNSGPDAIPIKEAFEMAHRAIERAGGGKV